MTLGLPERVWLGALGYRLARSKEGAVMYRQRPAPFYPAQVSQADISEAQVSPDGRLPFSFRDLSGGAGLAVTPLQGDIDRYDRTGDEEGEGVDCSLTPEGPVVLAGRLHPQVLPGAEPADHLAGSLWRGPAEPAFFAAGRYVYSFDGATWALRGDLGAGTSASGDLLAFRGVNATPTWYCPVGYANTLRYSTNQGASWLPVDTSGDVNQVQSLVELDGEVVMAMRSPRAGNAQIGVFDNGTGVPTLFNVIDPIGDSDTPISRIVAFNGRIVVLKDGEGVFLLDDQRRTLEQELFPELRGLKLHYQGATVWRGMLWLPTDTGLYVVTPGFSLQAVGPEQTETGYVAPEAPRGPITALAGDSHNLYAFRESTTGPSWVYKANVAVSGGGVEDVAWHPWQQQHDRAQCKVMRTSWPSGGGPRLVFGRMTPAGSGSPPAPADRYTAGWSKLPRKGRDPRLDVEYEYAPGGTLFYSRLIARFPGIDKSFYGITPLCAPLDLKVDGMTGTSAQSLRVLYKLDVMPVVDDPSHGYYLGLVQTAGTGTREPFVLFGRGLDAGIRMASTDPTTTPQLYSVTIDYNLNPLVVWRHEMTLDISSGAYAGSGLDGMGDPLTPQNALILLRQLPGVPGNVALTDPWGLPYDVSIPIDGVALRAGGAEEVGYTAEIPLLVDVVAVEQASRLTGTWGTVALMTWQQVSQYTWGQLPTLG